jgi:hypothetical protein
MLGKQAAGAHSSPTDYDALIEMGEDFVLFSFEKLDGEKLGPFKFWPNPALKNATTPCRLEWEKGVKQHGLTDCSGIMYAFHGTKTLEAYQAIAYSNLDPGKRRGQAAGPGEYFAKQPGLSCGTYSSGTNMVLVFAMIEKAITVDQSWGYVVLNPHPKDAMFCVPVGIVTFKSNVTDPQMRSA